MLLNSLAPGAFDYSLKLINFKPISTIIILIIFCEIIIRWMPHDLTDDKSTLVQVMAWCHQATSHYLSLCWPRPMSPYGVSRPQWVKLWWTYDLCQYAFNTLRLDKMTIIFRTTFSTWKYIISYELTEFYHKPDCPLSHWGRDKMAAISQPTFSNVFSWMKM